MNTYTTVADMLRGEVPAAVAARSDETVWGVHATTAVLADKSTVVDVLTSRADRMLYASDSEASAALVWAVATLLIHAPGGLTVFGVHFHDPAGGPCVDPECGGQP